VKPSIQIAHIAQFLFRTNCFIPRFDLGLVVQNHVQQGIMDFQFSVVFDKTQFTELVHLANSNAKMKSWLLPG
jgi:hypothetical protein